MTFLLFLVLLCSRCLIINGIQLPRPLQIIQRDFQALTRRVTAYHILLPKSDEVALALKQSIRNKSTTSKGKLENNVDMEKPMYVVDAFNQAAKKYSRCEDTASRGGLLGTLVPQGYCLAPELDKACFEIPLGEVSGPIESDYGYHLVLVEERTNCPKLDGVYTGITKGGPYGSETVFVKRVGSDREFNNIALVALQQVGFWIGVSFAGGIVAEIAAKTAGIFDTLPWEDKII